MVLPASVKAGLRLWLTAAGIVLFVVAVATVTRTTRAYHRLQRAPA